MLQIEDATNDSKHKKNAYIKGNNNVGTSTEGARTNCTQIFRQAKQWLAARSVSAKAKVEKTRLFKAKRKKTSAQKSGV